MEYFTELYLGKILNSPPKIFVFIELLVIAEVAAAFLLFYRRIPYLYFIVSSIIAIILFAEILPRQSTLELVTFLPYRIRMLALDSWIVILGWILGTILFGLCFIKSYRTASRIAVGTAIMVICTLMYAYHILIIQGSMKVNMHVEEQKILRTIDAPEEFWIKNCILQHYECGIIKIGENPEYHDEIINKEINDFFQFYRETADRPIRFSMSKGMVVSQRPFIAAFSEHDNGYRWVIERESATIYLSDATMMFMVIINFSIVFWFFGGALVIATHTRNKKY